MGIHNLPYQALLTSLCTLHCKSWNWFNCSIAFSDKPWKCKSMNILIWCDDTNVGVLNLPKIKFRQVLQLIFCVYEMHTLSVCLSTYFFSICLLFVFCLYLCICLYFFLLSVWLSTWNLCLSICPSVCLSVSFCQTVFLSSSLLLFLIPFVSLSLSLFLSNSLCTWISLWSWNFFLSVNIAFGVRRMWYRS